MTSLLRPKITDTNTSMKFDGVKMNGNAYFIFDWNPTFLFNSGASILSSARE